MTLVSFPKRFEKRDHRCLREGSWINSCRSLNLLSKFEKSSCKAIKIITNFVGGILKQGSQVKPGFPVFTSRISNRLERPVTKS
jgi:hypothetical protein